ncbi:MAG: antibiotic biosynthesis monooxygenase [Alphaproteobacteria bacterium]|nr:antibiotic biosynthesis monooxygenase [Alphaproteobacteria bacterium]
MIHVIATIELRPGTRDAFLAEFAKLIAPVRAEDGCIEYAPAIDADTDIAAQLRNGPDVVVVVEKWRDLPALKAHSVAPHMQAYRPRVKDYVVATRLQILQPAD